MEEKIEQVKSIILMHETRDFDALSKHILESEFKKAKWFSEERFTEVCDAIENEIGNIVSLEFIAALNRKSSYLTLWRTTYSKSDDEVLWQIIFDTESDKIVLMHINWQQLN